MKKVICLLLSIVLLFSFSGCNKENSDNNTQTDASVTQARFQYYEAPQYNEKVLNPNYLKENDYLKVWDEENSHLKENFELLQGKVIDLYYSFSATYALTEDAVYCIDNFAIYINKLDIEVGDNTKIVMANARSNNEHSYIVLKNDSNVYSVYIADVNDITKFYRCNIDNFKPAENEQIIAYNDAGYTCINLISYTNTQVNVRSYTVTNPNDASTVIYNQQTLFLEDNTSNSKIVQYLPDVFLNTNKGMYLLENGELHIVEELCGNDYQEPTLNTLKKVDNVSYIIGKDAYHIYFKSNIADEGHIIFTASDDADIEEVSCMLFMPDNAIETNTNNVIYNVDEHFLTVQKDNTVVYYDTTNRDGNIVLEDTLTKYLQEGKILGFSVYKNITLVLMDDHYIYSFIP